MARPRNRKNETQEQDNDNTTTTSAQSAQIKERTTMSSIADLPELDLDDINSLLSDTRARGEYGDYLKDFIASGKVGIEVKFDDPLMVGKDPDKAKIGFENAKKATVKDSNPPALKVEGGNLVKVVKKNAGTKDAPEWHLFLINTALVNAAAA